MRRRTTALGRVLAMEVGLGLLAGLAGPATASAKTTACNKGFVRNKARKCVRKAAATTTKKSTIVNRLTFVCGTGKKYAAG